MLYGTKSKASVDKVYNQVYSLLKQFSQGLNVNIDLLYGKISANLVEGISEEDLYELVASQCAMMNLEHPDYSILAANIKVDWFHRITSGFLYATEIISQRGLINSDYYRIVQENSDAIIGMIDYGRDFNCFDYFGISTLYKIFLLKDDNRLIERPQDMLMRVAVTVSNKLNEPFDSVKTKITYDLLSNQYYIHATPTILNSGLKMQQLASCFLVATESDSIEGIFNTLKEGALISKGAGGTSFHMHNVRPAGSRIYGTNGVSGGLIPFLKIFNETARCVDQGGGKRKGSFAIYLEPWHGDIEQFLELRKNTGSEEFRARDLFYALWIPDLFMERIEQDLTWTLMGADTCPGLADSYGEEFRRLYESYEAEGRGIKILPARQLLSKIVEAQIETGQPYMLYKDAVNRKSNQMNIGTIKSSNLCAEIVEYSSSDETAVCNLASLSLPKFVRDGHIDYYKIYEVTKTITENLNNLIDVNFYPTPKAKKSNMKNRPIAIGIQGLADVFFKLGIPYCSIQAREINKKIFATIYYAAIEKSAELAANYGTYDNYQHSPISQGKFQFDLWGVDPVDISPQLDWNKLRDKVNQYGVYNSLTTACMPTATTSIILGNTESFQIQTSNMFKRQTLSGEFLIINRYLVADLEALGLWNKEVCEGILLNNGSIANIDIIPSNLKEVYKTVWESSQKIVLEMSADRAPYIDQTQSLNLWLEHPTFKQVCSMHFYGWKLGLKTGMYYLRSRPPVSSMKMTISKEVLEQFKQKESSDICMNCHA